MDVNEAVKTIAPLSKQAAIILDEIHKGIKAIAPDVAAAVGRAIFWESLVNLITWAILLTLIVFAWKKWMPILISTFKDANSNSDLEAGCVIAMVFIGIFTVIVCINFCSTWFDPMTWMGLLDQKAYLASKIIHKIM